MGRPRKRQDAVATDEVLLDAAVLVFARDGLRGASLAEIASHAGVSRPALLYYWPTKEALYDAALTRVFERILGALAPGFSTTGAWAARLRAVVAGFSAFVSAEPSTSRLLLRAIVADDDPATRDLVLTHAVPVIGGVEDFVFSAIQPELPAQVDAVQVRAAIRSVVMTIVVDLLCHSAAGPVASALWGPAGDDRVAHLERLIAIVGAPLAAPPVTTPPAAAPALARSEDR